ncbi:hypothetical protein VMCG_10754 [Cytospora schulzeri]|uniref:Uncharacterized protein n=1 Tax=Cytospora schulzeri TaxID=448051 RepID=A0A423V8S8_9PEZI|nr:hypothetical protein VMCG_10754 [Valsa malicola]
MHGYDFYGIDRAKSPFSKLSKNLLEHIEMPTNINLPFRTPEDLSGFSDVRIDVWVDSHEGGRVNQREGTEVTLKDGHLNIELPEVSVAPAWSRL